MAIFITLNVEALTSMVVLIPFSREDSDPGADVNERGVVGVDESLENNAGEEDDMDEEDEELTGESKMGNWGDLDRVRMV